MKSEKRVMNIAHKGASGTFPGNTLLAFEKALEMGADMLEIDLRISKDGEVIVFHDEQVQMGNTGKRAIAALTISEIKTVELGMDQHIATFKEVLCQFRDRCMFYIDLKTKTALADVLVVLQEEQCIDRAILGVSDPVLLEKVRILNDRLRVSLLVSLQKKDTIFALGREFKPDFLHPCWEDYRKAAPSSLLTKEFFQEAHEHGFGIVTWHEEHEEELERLASLPVYGICTDTPDRLSRILKKNR